MAEKKGAKSIFLDGFVLLPPPKYGTVMIEA